MAVRSICAALAILSLQGSIAHAQRLDTAPAVTGSGCAQAAEAWKSLSSSNSVEALKGYRAGLPKTCPDQLAAASAQITKLEEAAEADRKRQQTAAAERERAAAELRKQQLAAEERERVAADVRKQQLVNERVAAEVRKQQLAAEERERVAAIASGAVFRDCTGCPEMMPLPAGSFQMGSPRNEKGRSRDEAGKGGAQRVVTIAYSFAVGKYEVTLDEYSACVADGVCPDAGDDGFGKGNRPVTYVSWWDANKYTAWLSRNTGQHYRLLSEAEWEYAARAGTTGRFSNDGAEAQLCSIANGADATSTCDDGHLYTAPVGSYLANAFGLHDMHGNAWEWVEDCYADSYSGAPSDGRAVTASACSNRVVRGGSWGSEPQDLRSANRGRNPPENQGDGLGFRLARTLPP